MDIRSLLTGLGMGISQSFANERERNYRQEEQQRSLVLDSLLKQYPNVGTDPESQQTFWNTYSKLIGLKGQGKGLLDKLLGQTGLQEALAQEMGQIFTTNKRVAGVEEVDGARTPTVSVGRMERVNPSTNPQDQAVLPDIILRDVQARLQRAGEEYESSLPPETFRVEGDLTSRQLRPNVETHSGAGWRIRTPEDRIAEEMKEFQAKQAVAHKYDMEKLGAQLAAEREKIRLQMDAYNRPQPIMGADGKMYAYSTNKSGDAMVREVPIQGAQTPSMYNAQQNREALISRQVDQVAYAMAAGRGDLANVEQYKQQAGKLLEQRLLLQEHLQRARIAAAGRKGRGGGRGGGDSLKDLKNFFQVTGYGTQSVKTWYGEPGSKQREALYEERAREIQSSNPGMGFKAYERARQEVDGEYRQELGLIENVKRQALGPILKSRQQGGGNTQGGPAPTGRVNPFDKKLPK